MVNNVPVTSSGDRREYSDPAAPRAGDAQHLDAPALTDKQNQASQKTSLVFLFKQLELTPISLIQKFR